MKVIKSHQLKKTRASRVHDARERSVAILRADVSPRISRLIFLSPDAMNLSNAISNTGLRIEKTGARRSPGARVKDTDESSGARKPVESARQSVVLLCYCHDSRGPLEVGPRRSPPRHVYEFIAAFVPRPVIQRAGTYRLLGSLLLCRAVKRETGARSGTGEEEEGAEAFSALKRRHAEPLFPRN